MAQPQQQQDPDSCYMPYYPVRDPRRAGLTDSSLLYYIKTGTLDIDKPHVVAAADKLMQSVIQWMKRYIQNHCQGNVVITTVPRSTAGELHGFLVELCQNVINGLPNATYHPLLERKQTGLASHQGGERNQSTHQLSIQVNLPDQGVQGAVVLVLDDIWTSGSTMRACKENLKQKLGVGADIRLLAIGRTSTCK